MFANGYSYPKSVPQKARSKFFGPSHTDFLFYELKNEDSNEELEDESNESINNILTQHISNYGDSKEAENYKNNEGDFSDSNLTYSIIDFPNFLMQVLRSYVKISSLDKVENDEKGEKDELRLDAKFLLNDFDECCKKENNFPEKFIAYLFYIRVCFDRFIIKTQRESKNIKTNESNNEESFSWSLKKPQYKGDKRSFVNTFSKEFQPRIIKAQSMLQVSFSGKTYKRWLYDLIVDFGKKWEKSKSDKADIFDTVFDSSYEKKFLEIIDKCIKDRYQDLKLKYEDRDYCPGTNVPHFLLNLIDYLYWRKFKKGELSYQLNDFDFRYWNSVEHHLAVSIAKSEGLENVVDSLGNLYLIGSGANASLSNLTPQEKIDHRINKLGRSLSKGPNRQIIYQQTRYKNRWGKSEIDSHYHEVVELLRDIDKVLDLEKGSTKRDDIN